MIPELNINGPADPIPIEQIVTQVADDFGVPVRRVISLARSEPLPDIRFIAMYILYDRYNMTLEAIGNYFGRHHTTVLHGIHKVAGSVYYCSYVDKFVLGA